MYRGTSLIRKPTSLGSPQVPRHRATVGSHGGGVLISEVPLYLSSGSGVGLVGIREERKVELFDDADQRWIHPRKHLPRGALPISGMVLNLRRTTCRNVERVRGGLVSEAHRLIYRYQRGMHPRKHQPRGALPISVTRCICHNASIIGFRKSIPPQNRQLIV